MGRSYWGNSAGTSASRFRAYIEYRTTTQEETRAWVQRKFSCHVDQGDFWGSHFNRSWGGQFQAYGVGWYADSGWQDVGWVNYGASHSSSCNVNYLSSSSGYQVSSCSATYSPDVPTWTPKAPTRIAVSRKSNNQNVISWTRQATTARPYASQVVERSTDGGSWVALATLGGTATSYTDNSTAANHRYAYRVKAVNSAGSSGYATSGWVYNTPNAPTGCACSRNSDTKNTVTWSLGSSDTGLYSGHKIERQVNGGTWTQIATVGASAKSYADTTTAANNFYAYRVRSYNGAGDSGYSTSGTTYNTPSAPGKPAISRTSDAGVKGEFSNGANTATALEVQRSTDRDTWVAVSSISGRVTTFADAPGGGTFYYRIRNTRGSLASAWVQSDGIVTICAPAAPTITAPASSAVVPKAQESIGIAWKHNPIDGSAQTEAQVRWSTDGGSTWQTAAIGTDATYTLANDFLVNDTVSVQVRTRGSHADFGPWSASRQFFVYQVPTVTVEQPGNEFTVKNMPIHVRIAYDDPSGTLSSGRFAVSLDGAEVYVRDITGALDFDIETSDWVPLDGGVYAITASVRSSSTLQATATRDFNVEFDPPSMAVVDAVPDMGTGYVALTVRKIDDGLQEIDHCTLYRECGGKTVQLAENLHDGDTVIDKYAPLNVPFSYVTASYAASGSIQQARFPGNVATDEMFFYWGEDGVAKGKYNPTDEFSVSPSYETVEVAGGDYPIAVIGTGLNEPHVVSLTLKSREEAMLFYEMAQARVPVVYKSLYGAVMHAIAVPKFAPRLSLAAERWEITLDVVRTAGDEL